jgi:hypothetical protein
MIPVAFDVGVQVRMGPTTAPALATDGTVRTRQIALTLDVSALWSLPSPEPDTGCSAEWTWALGTATSPDSPEIVAWLDALDAPVGVVLRSETAATAASDCELPQFIPPAALVGDGVVVALGPNPYLPWRDAVAALSDILPPSPGIEDWPWLESDHVLGATFAVIAPDGTIVGAQAGVAVALTLDEGLHVVPTGGGRLKTLRADALLADPTGQEVVLRATTLSPFVPLYDDWVPPDLRAPSAP